MKNLVKKIPFLRSIAKVVYFTFIAPFKSFSGSEDYWRQRYRSGETSGEGSYNKFAEFKAEVLNIFVREKQIRTIIEYGCGDGNQLRLSEYPSYIGFDVSPEAILQCESLFSNDETKTFKLMDAYANETADLTLSLDVIYHLIEDNVFFTYIKRLFDSSTRFVIIYSSNTDKQERLQAAHVKHRKFSRWIEQNKSEWKLVKHIPNRYPYTGDEQQGSVADFYIYDRTGTSV
ncbi:MAG: methyltransferase domain-containing protein [Pseudomonadota bacterium]